jgi:desulfoferrodoxin (superoxide reductase-like protein)
MHSRVCVCVCVSVCLSVCVLSVCVSVCLCFKYRFTFKLDTYALSCTHTHQRENEDIQDIPVTVRAYKPSELTHVIALTKPAKTMKKSKQFHQSLRYACLCITKPRATTFMSISSVNICMKKSYCNQEYLYEESILHQERLQI